MKKYIAKVRQKGEAYTQRVTIILASISTLAVVAIWLTLTSLLPTEERVIPVPTAPTMEDIFQETRSQFETISASLNEAPELFPTEEMETFEAEVLIDMNE